MLEWITAHPVLTTVIVLLLTIRIWFLSVIVVLGIAAAAVGAALLATLAGVAFMWEWLTDKIKERRRS